MHTEAKVTFLLLESVVQALLVKIALPNTCEYSPAIILINYPFDYETKFRTGEI